MLRPRLVSSEPPPLSPERQALAAAIEGQRVFGELVDATQRALGQAQDRLRAAREARDAANAALGAAKVAAADHLVNEARGTPGEAPVSVRAARAALIDAEDALEVAETAVKTLRERADEHAQQEAAWAIRNPVTAALAEVVAKSPETARLLAYVQWLQHELADKALALGFLANNPRLPDLLGKRPEGGPEAYYNWPVKKTLDRLSSSPEAWARGMLTVREGIDPPCDLVGSRHWKIALDALLVDPTAPLPEVRPLDPIPPEAA